MRVLHFYKASLPETMGGIPQVIRQLALGTARSGGHVDVLALSDRGGAPVETEGYTLHRARRDFQIASTGFSAACVPLFARLARQADLVHYHFPWPFMDLVHFVTQAGKPALVTYHSDIVRQSHWLRLYRPLMRRFLSSVDRIVATSPNYAATSPVLARYADKLSVVPIGLDRATYPPPAPDRLQSWRARLGDGFFLFVGVLRYYKGLHALIRAAQGAAFTVVVLGSGPAAPELKALAARLGIRQMVFLGALPDEDKIALLTLCRGVVLPSHLRSEAFGVSLLEGAMHGKPLVSSEIGTGTSYVNRDGETGLVVAPDEPASLRAALDRLWREPALAAEMGRRAEARYRRLFTVERMTEGYLDLYRSLVPGGP